MYISNPHATSPIGIMIGDSTPITAKSNRRLNNSFMVMDWRHSLKVAGVGRGVGWFAMFSMAKDSH